MPLSVLPQYLSFFPESLLVGAVEMPLPLQRRSYWFPQPSSFCPCSPSSILLSPYRNHLCPHTLQSGDLHPQGGKQVLSPFCAPGLCNMRSLGILAGLPPTRKMLPAQCFMKTLKLTVTGKKPAQEGNVGNQAQRSLQSLPLCTAWGPVLACLLASCVTWCRSP